MNKASPKPIVITICLYVLFFLYSLVTVMIGPQVLTIMEEFSISITVGSFFNMFLNIGSVLGVLISIFILHRLHKTRITAIFFGIYTVSLILIGFSGNMYMFIFLLFTCGIGGKFVDSACNSLVGQLNEKNTAFYVNLLHASYAIGSFAGPIALSTILEKGLTWRDSFSILGILSAVALCIFIFLQRNFKDDVSSKTSQNAPSVSYRELISPRIIIAIITILLIAGYQISLNSWYPAYMTEILHTEGSFANLSLSLFWLGLFLGRIVCALLSRRIRPEYLLKAGTITGALCICIGVFSQTPVVTTVFISFTGFFAGGAIPLIMSIGFKWYPTAKAKLSPLLIIFLATGTVIMPLLSGILSDVVGFYGGMILIFAILALAALCTVLFPLKQPPKK